MDLNENQVKYNGKVYDIIGKKDNQYSKYECIVSTETGEIAEGDQREIAKFFIELNGETPNQISNNTHAWIRQLLDIFKNNTNSIREYDDSKTKFITKKSDIDYRCMFEFVKEYAGEIYSKNPENLLSKGTITNEEANKIKQIQEDGNKALKELEKLANLLANSYALKTKRKLIKSGSNKFAKQNNPLKTGSQVRDYLWFKFVDLNKGNLPFSLSIFVRLKDENEIIELGIEPIYNDYGKIVSANNAKYDNALIEETKISKIKFDALEINHRSKIIFRNDNLTSEEYTKELESKFLELIPYYENIIGMNDTKDNSIISDSINIKKNLKSKSNIGLNTILYGPPGTGKTFYTKKYVVAICDNKTLEDIDKLDYENRYKELIKEGRTEFITFHQSYGYEEFIEGIKPNVDENKNISYGTKEGIFKKFCNKAKKELDNEGNDVNFEPKSFVFVIDEINRANISKVFGELITLIEEPKRGGMKEETSAILPYSGESFCVPKNVYILGTMNTADRSISLIDTALRRRFNFVEMMPNSSIVDVTVDGVNVKKMLDTINERITVLYDREHMIGHAFFTNLNNDSTIEDLALIFKNKIIPLLQEYFYEDYSKIRLVLGDNSNCEDKYKFIEEIDNSKRDIFKGNFDLDIVENYKYEINYQAFNYAESYIKIYSREEESDE